jgi:hypothetical protein
MAKAIYVPGVQYDPRLVAEVVSLRARVAELEQELASLRLADSSFDEDVLTLTQTPAVLA